MSQGSVLTLDFRVTRLRCGGIVNDRCIANFLEIVTVKEFLKSANICRAFGVHFFGPPCKLSAGSLPILGSLCGLKASKSIDYTCAI